MFAGRAAASELLPAPAWNVLPFDLSAGDRLTRILDLRTGTLRQELAASGGPVVAAMFASLARPGTAALRAEAPAELLRAVGAGSPFTPFGPGSEASVDLDGHGFLVSRDGAGVAAATSETLVEVERGRRRLERLAAYRAGPSRPPSLAEARERLLAAESDGFERLLVEHREAWAARFEEADVTIAGDPELQLAVRVALFHLIGSSAVRGETALGARGTSGPGYRGHVFWDADVFVLPSLPRPIRRRPAPCSSIASRACRLHGRPRRGEATRAPAFRGSRPGAGGTSPPPGPSIGTGGSFRSSPARMRSMSSPTLPGPPPTTLPGAATASSHEARAGCCSSRPPATGPPGSGSTPRGARTSTT